MTDQKYRLTSRGIRADGRGAGLQPGSVLVADRVASFYDETLAATARGTVADLGCGTAPLRAIYGPLATRTIAMDWPSSVHDVRLDAYADLGHGVPLRSLSVDTVLISDVLEHIADPQDLLRECHRVLTAGGRLVGNTPFMYGLHEEPHDYFRYTEHGLRHLLTLAGFAEIDVRPVGGGIDVVIDVLAKLTSRIPAIGPGAARGLQRAWIALTAPGRVRRWLRETERRLPLGYGFVASVGDSEADGA